MAFGSIVSVGEHFGKMVCIGNTRFVGRVFVWLYCCIGFTTFVGIPKQIKQIKIEFLALQVEQKYQNAYHFHMEPSEVECYSTMAT